MLFPSIDIQGSILSNDLLLKIKSERASSQHGKDFNRDLTNAKLKDEISLAWQEAKGQWAIYKSKLARLKEGDSGVTVTRNFWISPLLTNLGYNLSFNKQPEELAGKSFPIGYRDTNLDNFPIYIGGFNESLDKRPANKALRVSPHALLQEYLNYSEHLYGIVTNGRQLRLLRDASRITRLTYVAFDLEKMMDEDLYPDFVILYRLIHASRMPRQMGDEESIIDKYHREGLDAGSTIRSKLGAALKGSPGESKKGAIELLGTELLNHTDNAAIREAFEEGRLEEGEYYRQLLRIIYRLLFLFVIEERNLVYIESKTPTTKRFNDIYFQYYSLLRLRKLASKVPPPDANRHSDLWQGLMSTFSLFEKQEIGEKLGITSLQGDLFGYDAISNDRYDLHRAFVSNSVLLNVIQALAYFENENGVLISVNYGDLDVEEFGSVYEGLLELKLVINKVKGSELYRCAFDTSDERGTTGSHYTPEEMVQPLIQHSLDHLIEDRIKPFQQKKATRESTIQALLQLKVCDATCGSGHILLSAARHLATAVAYVRTDEEQPNPLAIRKATKDVIRNCIFGVDRNPLAVELCKIALWLEAYNPMEPLNFLDHHIKCGDAIVGLARREELENGIPEAAFKTLVEDDKDVAKSFRNKNKKERNDRTKGGAQLSTDFEKNTKELVEETMGVYRAFNSLPETTPEEITIKAKAYKKFEEGKGVNFIKAMSDAQVAQFFIPKTDANKDVLLTDADFRSRLYGYKGWQDAKMSNAGDVASERRFFHWFVEFPAVFSEGGFDCILGNPPYLGGTLISGAYGKSYYEYLIDNYPGASNRSDLLAYFLRRFYDVIKVNGYLSLISTKTIAEGDTRAGGLDIILSNGGTINYAGKAAPWPGKAAVVVLEISLFKGKYTGNVYNQNTIVDSINSYLESGNVEMPPESLVENGNLGFTGSYIFGDGFTLDPLTAEELISSNPHNKEILFPYLNGEDLNSSYLLEPSRWVINFSDMPIEEAEKFEECFKIVEAKVKPFRMSKSKDVASAPWWQFWRLRKALYNKIQALDRLLIHTRVTKTHGFAFVPSTMVYSDATVVISDNRASMFSYLQSALHEAWAWKYSSRLKSDRRYSVEDCFIRFPFPEHRSSENEQLLERIGEAYHRQREKLMQDLQLGLTKVYNLFHSKSITTGEVDTKDERIESLRKHLKETDGAGSIEEAVRNIVELRKLQVEMDNAVLAAYGWLPSSSLPPGESVELKHDFYEVDYLPESDRVRFTIHPEARKLVLKKLLDLNLEIHEQEVEKGLYDKKEKKKRHAKKDTAKNELDFPE